MQRRWFVWALMVLVAAGVGLPAGATSLWSSEASFYADQRARQVGDLVTLIIAEKSQAQQNAGTTTGQDTSFTLGPGLGFLDILPLLELGGGDTFRSGGTTTRGGQLTARMTTEVVEVLPSGNLMIKGSQSIRINGEEQLIVVTGTIRPRDISRDNTILSTYVADANISFEGTGSLGSKQSPGLLTRLFNWLF